MTVAAAADAPIKDEDAKKPAGVGLASGLVARETLERLGFFLESSLEEKLLSRVSGR